MTKQYVGDGVYIQIENNQIILTTEDGINVQNKIYLEPSMIDYIVTYTQAYIKEVTK